LIGLGSNAGQNGLLNQWVASVESAERAVGRVFKRQGGATGPVTVMLMSSLLPFGITAAFQGNDS